MTRTHSSPSSKHRSPVISFAVYLYQPIIYSEHRSITTAEYGILPRYNAGNVAAQASFGTDELSCRSRIFSAIDNLLLLISGMLNLSFSVRDNLSQLSHRSTVQ